MLSKYARLLREGEAGDGGGGGGAGGAVFSDSGSGGDQGGQASGGAGGQASDSGSGSGTQSDGQGGTPPVAPVLTADAIAEAMKKAGLGGQPAAAAAQPERQLSQEDLDRAFQTWHPTPELLTQITAGGENGLKALMAMRDGLVRQAVTMASLIVQDRMQKYQDEFRPQFEPVLSYVNEARVAQMYKEFYEENKDLTQYDAVVRAAVDQMKSEKLQFATKKEGFKTLADRTRAILKSIPGFQAGGEPNGNQGGSSSGATRMPALSRGGQGGAGNGQPNAGGKNKSPGMAVFS